MNRQLMTMLAIIGVLIVLVWLTYDPRPADTARHTAKTVRPVDAYGNCLMHGLGNQSMNFAGIVRERLRNPKSFEHVKTDPGQVADGVFPVMMTYRATNGYGAVDTYVARGEVRVSDCAAKVLSL